MTSMDPSSKIGVPIGPASVSGQRKASPTDARQQNRALLLRTLFAAGPMSRADLARTSELTPTTVSNVIAALLGDGLIEEAGRADTGGVGKPATLVSVVPDARHVVCIDLSASGEIRGAVVDLTRQFVLRRNVSRRHRSGEALTEAAVGLAAELVDHAERPLLGIGVATPGVVDDRGVVVRSAHLGFDHMAVGPLLSTQLGLPVRVANDAHAAALGELAFTGASGNLLLVRITEGIGAGLVLNHRLFTGTSHAAGEIGHVVVNPRGELCACGMRGCLETVVTTPLASGRRDRATLARAGRHLGSALAHLVSALNLDSVVLSGTDGALGEPFRAATLDAIKRRTLADIGDSVVVRLSDFGDDDALLGAAVLILDQELGVA